MSRRFYLLFCELNSKKPTRTQSRIVAKSFISKKKYTNMLSFTTKSKARICQQQRLNIFQINKISLKAKSYQNQRNKLLAQHFDPLDNAQINMDQTKVPKPQPFVCKDILVKMFQNIFQNILIDFNYLMKKFKPLSIESSIYRSKIFPEQTYKAYLSTKANQTLLQKHLYGQRFIGYYFTKRQQIFHERTFMTRKQDDLEISLKGICYLILDSYLNGIKKLEINCDSKSLFLVWQDLVNKKLIQEENSQQNAPTNQKGKQHNLQEKNQTTLINQSRTDSNENNENKDDKNKDDTSNDLNEVNENVIKKNNYLKYKFKTINYQDLFGTALLDFQKIQKNTQNDYEQECQKLKNSITSYEKGKFRYWIQTLKELSKQMDYVSLKLICAEENFNAIQLINQRLETQIIRSRQRSRKWEQLLEKRKQQISKIPSNIYSRYDEVKRIQKIWQRKWIQQNPYPEDQ